MRPPSKLSAAMWRILPAERKREDPPQLLWRGQWVPVRIVPGKRAPR